MSCRLLRGGTGRSSTGGASDREGKGDPKLLVGAARPASRLRTVPVGRDRGEGPPAAAAGTASRASRDYARPRRRHLQWASVRTELRLRSDLTALPFLSSSSMLHADYRNVDLLRKSDAVSARLAFLRLEEGMTLISCSGDNWPHGVRRARDGRDVVLPAYTQGCTRPAGRLPPAISMPS